MIFSELSRYVLQPASSSRTKRQEFGALGPDLYDGVSGLAVFFAAYYRATKDPQAHKVAMVTMARVRDAIARLPTRTGMPHTSATTIGGLIGLGSILYALTTAADWLDAPELLDSAFALVGTITPGLIRADHSLGVMKGCAGTLLTLMSFAQAIRSRGIQSQYALDLAMVCGRHLLHSRTSSASGLLAWPDINGQPLAGFALGATGISYALNRLYEETNEDEFRDAAFEGFAAERAFYGVHKPGWRTSNSNQSIASGSWCQGTAGLALGRLSCVCSRDEPGIRYDLEEALRLTRASPEAPGDQLCCGNFGRIDTLYTAGSVLGRLKLSDHAQESSRRIVERSLSDDFVFASPLHEGGQQRSSNFRPSLFLGLAGVGYTLLRLRYPELLPSVLLLESSNNVEKK